MKFWRNYCMSKLQKERLEQMIENPLSYKQEVKEIKSYYIKGLKT